MPNYSFGPFLLDSEARTLLRNGEPIALRGKIFDTLLLLVANKGRLLTKDELLSSVWQSTNVEEANLTQTIFSARKILGDPPKEHRFIATVPGRGYQFVAQVTEVVPTSQAISRPSDRIQINSKPLLNRLTVRWLSASLFCVTTGLVIVSSYNSPRPAPVLEALVQLTNDGKPKNELVTDGVRVFYASPTEQNLSHWRTYQIPAEGGESQLFPAMSLEMSPFDISPDRKKLLLGSSEIRQSNDGWTTPNQLWSQPLAGGPPKLLAVRAQDASWSPRGDQIVYAIGRQIGVASTYGAPGHKLADLPGVPSGLRWSPSGDKIRFTLHYGETLRNSAIWELPLREGKAHPLFPDSKDQQGDGQWTPDGKYYLFSKTQKGVSQIWALPELKAWFRQSFQMPVQLTTGPMQCFLPTPSPDRKRLLFYGMSERALLVKYDLRSRHFDPFLPGTSGEHLDFSRDGKWVTYSSYPEHALWRVAADGTQRLQLSPPDMIAMLPVISPDGARIAFVGGSPGQPFSIFVVGLHGGALQAVAPSEPIGLVEPAWSPDGASLVLGTSNEKSPLYRFDLANRRLTALPGSEGLWSPRWSPDGRCIAALSASAPNLMLYDLESRLKTELTNRAASYPAWSRNGQYIYFGSGEQDEAWYRMRVRDRMLERIVSLSSAGALPAKPSRGIPTWINSWKGLAPDDSLLAAREAGGIEIYSADLVER